MYFRNVTKQVMQQPALRWFACEPDKPSWSGIHSFRHVYGNFFDLCFHCCFGTERFWFIPI